MPKLVILGSSYSIPDENHENTHMAVVGRDRTILIDCVSNPIVRLHQAGLNHENISDLIITHFHPDHVSGIPLLLMDMWLLGRRTSFNLYGLEFTLERIRKLMELYDWGNWPNFFPVSFNPLPEEEMTPVLESDEWRIFSSPVSHLIPTIGLRIEFQQTKKVLAYSCDTDPCPQVVRLAKEADVLIHETSGNSPGHSSASQAGDIAQQAGVKSLYLIHYPPKMADSLFPLASKNFGGPVALAKDFMELDF